MSSPRRASYQDRGDYGSSKHYSYEDEDQRPQYSRGRAQRSSYIGPTYNSIDNIAEFFASRGKKFTRPKIDVPAPAGRTGFRPGQRVVIRNMAKAQSTGARAMGKTRRLRYNFLSSV